MALLYIIILTIQHKYVAKKSSFLTHNQTIYLKNLINWLLLNPSQLKIICYEYINCRRSSDDSPYV